MIGINIIAMLFYGLLGLAAMYLIIHYAVRTAIDSSVEVKLLKDEVKQLKRELKNQ